MFRVLGSTLRVKAQVYSSSRGQKDFICREEKRKAACDHVRRPGNRWSCGLGWKLSFYSLFHCPRVEMSLRYKEKFSGKEKCLFGPLSPCSMSFIPFKIGVHLCDMCFL
jgi:hypothetical protein